MGPLDGHDNPPAPSGPYAGFLSVADVSSCHRVEIRGRPEDVFRTLIHIDIGRSPIIRLLFLLRGLSREMLTFRGLQDHGFTPLHQVDDAELVMGIVGQFWTPTGRLRSVSPEDFSGFDEPGWAKAVWGFVLEDAGAGRVRLTTETHVRCTGDLARRRFKRYWFLVGPFSGLIRREILRLVRETVESGDDAS